MRAQPWIPSANLKWLAMTFPDRLPDTSVQFDNMIAQLCIAGIPVNIFPSPHGLTVVTWQKPLPN